MLSVKFKLNGEEYTSEISLPDTLEQMQDFHFDLRDCLYTVQIKILEERFKMTKPFDKGLLDRLNYYDN